MAVQFLAVAPQAAHVLAVNQVPRSLSRAAEWTESPCSAFLERRRRLQSETGGRSKSSASATLASGLAAGAVSLVLARAPAGCWSRRGADRRERVVAAAEGRPTSYDPKDWVQRVKMIEGERAVFDVTIPKPLGLIPANFPSRPGVGVAKITPEGNTDMLNRRVILDGEEGMWVLEGDEVVSVNGVTVEGQGLDQVGPMVKEAPGDSVTLTLCRHYYAGPVKVVFVESGKVVTMKRGVEISQAAKVGVEDVAFSCKEGWCKACWHTDPMFGVVYRACSANSRKRPPPKNPRTIPKTWNNVVPLWLLNWKQTMQWAKELKEDREGQRAERLARFEESKKGGSSLVEE